MGTKSTNPPSIEGEDLHHGFDFDNVELTIISEEAHNKLAELIENPPQPTQALKELMRGES